MTHTPTLLDENEIADQLKLLAHWQRDDDHLLRCYRTAGWKSSLMVVNSIGHLAEAAWHHPDLHCRYNSVTVRLTTHSSGGLTMMDFELAARIEAVVHWQPTTDNGTLTGTPDDPRYRHVLYDQTD